MIEKTLLALKIAGWACFGMALISFVGIMDYFGTLDEANDSLMQGMFSEAFGLPDFKTIAWCALGIIIGLVLQRLTVHYGLICGWLINNSSEVWSHVVLEFVLLDEGGNDIMLDGQPVVLRNAEDFESDLGVIAGSVGRFETNVIKAKDLPDGVSPVDFRVQSVRKVYYEPLDI